MEHTLHSSLEQHVETVPPARHRHRMARSVLERLHALGPLDVTFAAVTALLVAPPLTLAPTPGLDSSWVATLNFARQYGFHHGSSIVFTLGPWGIVDVPLGVSRSQLLAALLFGLVAAVTSWTGLRVALPATWRPWAKALVPTLVIVPMTPAAAASSLLLVGICFHLIVSLARGQRHRIYVTVVIACLAGLLLEVRFSEGVVALAAVAVYALAQFDRWLRVAACVTSAALSIVAWWLLSGSHLADLPRWLFYSTEISHHYSEAMSIERTPNVLSYVLIALMILALGFLTFTFLRDDHSARAIGAMLIGWGLLYLGFREGTGRHEIGHAVFFYLFSLPLVVLMVSRGVFQYFSRLLLVLAILLSYNNLFTSPAAAQQRWADALQTLVDRGYQSTALDTARAGGVKQYALPANILNAIGDSPVSVDGTEVALPWFYKMQWQPFSTVQSYVAYSRRLDELGARGLRTAGDDLKILRPTLTGIDYRNSLWDPPQYVLEEMCTMKPAAVSPQWMVLEKTADRCGRPVRLGQVHARAGAAIRVPDSDPEAITTVSFTPDKPNLLARVGRTLNKPLKPLVVRTDGTGMYWLPRGQTPSPLIARVPGATGWPAQFGGTFSIDAISFSEPGTITFSTVSFN